MATETSSNYSMQHMREGYRASKDMVREHPVSAAATVFGLGFGLGVALGVLLSESEMASRRYDPSRMERMGRQLLEALAQAVPDAMSKRFS